MLVEITIEDILQEARTHRNDIDETRLKRVFEYALANHACQTRKTGDPYITHSINIAHTLASWRLDQLSIEAGLLHDLPEMSGITVHEIEKEFGPEVAQLVDGVNLVGQVRLRGSRDVEFLENLRKMFVYMAKDLRAILVRLADRRHNIITLEGLPIIKQRPIALETLEIYAPLAGRLGMGKAKSELEDLVFPYVYPDEFKWVQQIAQPRIKYARENTPEIINRFRQQLSKHNIQAKVEGRPKHMYSLYRKLQRPSINFDINLINDLMAIRIITVDTASCYSALGVIHQYWKPIPNLGISDFISQPKPNGYQSIHSKIFDNKGQIVEIQIRSEDMHTQAEFGAAAHFAYSQAKTSGVIEEKLQKGTSFKIGSKYDWVKQLVGWKEQMFSEKEAVKDFKLDALSQHIYVFSPLGDVYDLPENATPVDFAFTVHSDLGFFIQSVKINKKIAPIDAILKSGDIVEIVKTKYPKKPNKNWLRFVKTRKAKIEINKALDATGT